MRGRSSPTDAATAPPPAGALADQSGGEGRQPAEDERRGDPGGGQGEPAATLLAGALPDALHEVERRPARSPRSGPADRRSRVSSSRSDRVTSALLEDGDLGTGPGDGAPGRLRSRASPRTVWLLTVWTGAAERLRGGDLAEVLGVAEDEDGPHPRRQRGRALRSCARARRSASAVVRAGRDRARGGTRSPACRGAAASWRRWSQDPADVGIGVGPVDPAPTGDRP